MSTRLRLALVVTLVIACGILITSLGGPASGQAGSLLNSLRYTVVSTEGTNLLVTDNGTNTLYFYTIDEGGEPGDDLELRASIDLNKVGQPVITLTIARAPACAPWKRRIWSASLSAEKTIHARVTSV